jgi:hypothetical protein
MLVLLSTQALAVNHCEWFLKKVSISSVPYREKPWFEQSHDYQRATSMNILLVQATHRAANRMLPLPLRIDVEDHRIEYVEAGFVTQEDVDEIQEYADQTLREYLKDQGYEIDRNDSKFFKAVVASTKKLCREYFKFHREEFPTPVTYEDTPLNLKFLKEVLKRHSLDEGILRRYGKAVVAEEEVVRIKSQVMPLFLIYDQLVGKKVRSDRQERIAELKALGFLDATDEARVRERIESEIRKSLKEDGFDRFYSSKYLFFTNPSFYWSFRTAILQQEHLYLIDEVEGLEYINSLQPLLGKDEVHH